MVPYKVLGDMTSDGYICSAEDLALSRNSTVPLLYCLTRGQSFGLLVECFLEALLPIPLTPVPAECRIGFYIAGRSDSGLCPAIGERKTNISTRLMFL